MPYERINGTKLYYVAQLASKSAGKKTLTCFLIHGLGSSSSFYAPIIPRLAEAGINCIAVDTVGSGLSPCSDMPLSVQTIAGDFSKLMTTLGIDPGSTVLVGHSMGAMIACELASRQHYAGVILIGPVHPTSAVSDVFATRIKTVQEKGMEPIAETIPFAATGTRSSSLHKATIKALLQAQDPVGYIALCRVIAQAEAPAYETISCPILFIAGEDDKTSPIKNIMTIHNSCASPSNEKVLVSIEGVGHWHVIEAGDTVGKHVVDFVRKYIKLC